MGEHDVEPFLADAVCHRTPGVGVPLEDLDARVHDLMHRGARTIVGNVTVQKVGKPVRRRCRRNARGSSLATRIGSYIAHQTLGFTNLGRPKEQACVRTCVEWK